VDAEHPVLVKLYLITVKSARGFVSPETDDPGLEPMLDEHAELELWKELSHGKGPARQENEWD
jgi:hypothetical protein